MLITWLLRVLAGHHAAALQMKLDLDKIEDKMRSKEKFTCVKCIKYLQNKQAVEEHLKQAQISFVGRRARMQLKPTTCKVVKERVFNEEDILRWRINQESGNTL